MEISLAIVGNNFEVVGNLCCLTSTGKYVDIISIIKISYHVKCCIFMRTVCGCDVLYSDIFLGLWSRSSVP